MTAPRKDREEFIAQLTHALPDVAPHLVEHYARMLMRNAATHGRLAVESCNGHPIHSSPHANTDAARVSRLQQAWEARIKRQEKACELRITAICQDLGLTPDFGGDPRGYTVKVQLPTGASNTWGGREDGWGIPQ